MQGEDWCRVCFQGFHPTSKLKYRQRIECMECENSAHRFCYAPNMEENWFLCDVCHDTHVHSNKQELKQQIRCYVCGNKGPLMKKISGNGYAHPICLLFESKDVFVKSYTQLQFESPFPLKPTPQKKTSRCSICKMPSKGLYTCAHDGCKKQAHIYCILKLESTVSSNKWKHNIGYKNDKYDSTHPIFHHRLRKCVEENYKQIYYELWHNSSYPRESQLFSVACSEHVDLLEEECYCRIKQHKDTLWIQCSYCEGWYHFSCENATIEDIQEQSIYQCKQCTAWKKIVHSGTKPLLKQYPTLKLYDMVYIHIYLQRAKYALTKPNLQLLEVVQTMPSLVYSRTFIVDEVWKRVRNKYTIEEIDRILSLKDDNPTKVILHNTINLAELLLSSNLTKGPRKDYTEEHIERVRKQIIQEYFYYSKFIVVVKELSVEETVTQKQQEPSQSPSLGDHQDTPQFPSSSASEEDDETRSQGQQEEEKEKEPMGYDRLNESQKKEYRQLVREYYAIVDEGDPYGHRKKKLMANFDTYSEQVQGIGLRFIKALHAMPLQPIDTQSVVEDQMVGSFRQCLFEDCVRRFMERWELKQLNRVLNLYPTITDSTDQHLISILQHLQTLILTSEHPPSPYVLAILASLDVSQSINALLTFFSSIQTSTTKFPPLHSVLTKLATKLVQQSKQQILLTYTHIKAYAYIHKQYNVPCSHLQDQLNKNKILDQMITQVDLNKTTDQYTVERYKVCLAEALRFCQQQRLYYRAPEVSTYYTWYQMLSECLQIIPVMLVFPNAVPTCSRKKIPYSKLKQLLSSMKKKDFPWKNIMFRVEALVKQGTQRIKFIQDFMTELQNNLLNKKTQNKKIKWTKGQLLAELQRVKVSLFDYQQILEQFQEVLLIYDAHVEQNSEEHDEGTTGLINDNMSLIPIIRAVENISIKEDESEISEEYEVQEKKTQVKHHGLDTSNTSPTSIMN